MEIYALFGSSGTGKSSSALELAHRYKIDAIIDDGILIYQGRKAAGASAKYEKTKIQAVKRAIFFYHDQAEDVRQALRTLPIERLLILATSQRMISRIVDALGLPPVSHNISIESIKPEDEIKAARFVRETQGKHVIPIPRVEVEKDFLQRLIHSAQQILSPRKEIIGESTVVYPPFSGGRIQIYEQVLKKIVQHVCCRFPQVAQVHKTKYLFADLPRLHVSISLRLPFGASIPTCTMTIQQALYEELDYCFSILPSSIDFTIVSLEVQTE
ncbi:hypothetical protein LOK74_17165 [Brevibacillus humidisoli]|uniref:hypothetical protein n=1 Tax=Brevibacillus humidisoli TaxID=2895522 RepID=UPI001E2AA3B3|nr:hypothetical protein [Brevibacillus humidisoli]UFJ39769.1 hypothetical protein LOK74_17165 [Brevibacillus humidisoli]